jgi:hypothetical protein
MLRAPIRAVTEHEPAAGEECENVMARFQNLALKRVATSHDIAHAFLGLAWDVHRRQVTRAIQPRQLARIVRVMLPLSTGAFRNQRRRNHLAPIAPLAECTVAASRDDLRFRLGWSCRRCATPPLHNIADSGCHRNRHPLPATERTLKPAGDRLKCGRCARTLV